MFIFKPPPDKMKSLLLKSKKKKKYTKKNYHPSPFSLIWFRTLVHLSTLVIEDRRWV